MRRKEAIPTELSIGNCRLKLPAKLQYEQGTSSVKVKVPYNGEISISVEDTKLSANHSLECDNTEQQRRASHNFSSFSFALLNPKSLDIKGQSLLQEVLKLYNDELPDMGYAANTGKESPFLERCVTNGKYCTLLLNRQVKSGEKEVIGAITYQILPPDTQYAEIPLTAVAKNHQRKGYGAALYKELQRRLQGVGVLTVFCWGDQESERFWIKQGFLTVAEVDGRGKPRKLPIKPDVRRVMSIPGSATLMVSHITVNMTDSLSSDVLLISLAGTPPKHFSGKKNVIGALLPLADSDDVDKNARASPAAGLTTPILTEAKSYLLTTPTATKSPTYPEHTVHKNMTPLNMAGAFSSVACQHLPEGTNATPLNMPEYQNGHQERASHSTTITFFPREAEHGTPDVPAPRNEVLCEKTEGFRGNENVKPNEVCAEADKALTHQSSGEPSKKKGRCRRPLSTLDENKLVTGKRISRTHEMKSCSTRHVDGALDRPSHKIQKVAKGKKEIAMGSMVDDLESTGNPVVNDKDPGNSEAFFSVHKDRQMEADNTSIGLKRCKHVIMFMNLASEGRKIQLSQFVEKLGGSVTSYGVECTHVITGEIRRTFNFCAAICGGAWVVSPEWLKASVRSDNFVDESLYILKDKQYESKYRTTLEATVTRAKQRPGSLLDGFSIYVTKNVQPPIESVQQLISLAGGKVLLDLKGAISLANFTHTFIIACEEDMSEALVAAKEGLLTYTSEWFMSSIMKQDLDFSASQFTESLH